MIMHSLMFQTKVLRESEVKLPEHTFYVDNLFSYKPLPYAETIYYMDIDLYHYYLGRDDQSVNEKGAYEKDRSADLGNRSCNPQR